LMAASVVDGHADTTTDMAEVAASRANQSD
jgi:hypothetical protein